jgi:transcriptional regulator with XRE-family HTH domain
MGAVAFPFWRRILELIAELDINQTQLTKRAGVRLATFKGWETSTRPPQAALLTKIVNALNEVAYERGRDAVLDMVEARQLAGLIPTQGQPTSDDVRRLVQRTQSYTREQQAALLQIIDSFDAQNAQMHRASDRDDGT